MLLHETISIPGGPAEFVACCEKAVPQTNKLTPSKNSLATRIRDPFRSVKSGLKFSGLHVGRPKDIRFGAEIREGFFDLDRLVDILERLVPVLKIGVSTCDLKRKHFIGRVGRDERVSLRTPQRYHVLYFHGERHAEFLPANVDRGGIFGDRIKTKHQPFLII